MKSILESKPRNLNGINDIINFKRLPLQLNSDIILQPTYDHKRLVRTTVVDITMNNFIMIRASEEILKDTAYEEDIICKLLYMGYEFIFLSRIHRSLPDDVLCLRYPGKFEIRSLREHYRISVNISTEFVVEGFDAPIAAQMRDLSVAGCRLILSRHVKLLRGANAAISFRLPGSTLVENTQCTVSNAIYSDDSHIQEVGLCFCGPSPELVKIKQFCELCISQIGIQAPKVLLIDNDVNFAGWLGELLEKEGYQTSIAGSAEEGLQVEKELSFDVVVLDLGGPGIPEIEVVKAIKERRSTSPEVIIITGYSTIESALKCLQFGAVDYLTKPVEIGDLKRRIAEAHDRKALRERVTN